MKKKIVIINHALVIPVFRNRWERLAKDSEYEVHLIIPKYWEQYYFVEKVVYENEPVQSGDYNLHVLNTTNYTEATTFLFKGLKKQLQDIKPDLVYMIGNESIAMFQQVIRITKIFLPKTKILFFTMNAQGIHYKKYLIRRGSERKVAVEVLRIYLKKYIKRPIRRIKLWFRWIMVKNFTDAAAVHYPECLRSLREGGYSKPVFLQTQVGVNEQLFAPNVNQRIKRRKEIGFEDYFVVGFLGRLIKEKGVLDIANAVLSLINSGDKIGLLYVGNGKLKDEIIQLFEKDNATNHLHITDFVDQAVVPDFLNAMDVLVLGSHTTTHWIDTFPLATVQAQAVGIPVIASDSASIPWQQGDSALLYPERNTDELTRNIKKLLINKEFRAELATKGMKRSHEYFCHRGMTDNFIKIVDQVLNSDYTFHKPNEEYTQWKAY